MTSKAVKSERRMKAGRPEGRKAGRPEGKKAGRTSRKAGGKEREMQRRHVKSTESRGRGMAR